MSDEDSSSSSSSDHTVIELSSGSDDVASSAEESKPTPRKRQRLDKKPPAPKSSRGGDARQQQEQNRIDLGYRLTTVHGVAQRFNSADLAISAKKVIGDGIAKGAGKLVRSAQFNYMFDLEWLLDQYPSEGRTAPLLIVHAMQGDSLAAFRTSMTPYSHVSLARAQLEFQYGTHHSKIMLLQYEKGLRIVIHTANLIPYDWYQKTQTVWMSPVLPKVASGGATGVPESRFKKAFTQYLAAYKLAAITEWIRIINEFDLSPIDKLGVDFVGSVPGRHTGATKNDFGHMRLRTLVESASSAKTSRPGTKVVAQFSSIGSLGKAPETWLTSEFFRSCGMSQAVSTNRPLLIFPSVEDVRTSLEGYAGGGCLPYSSATAEKQPWLQSSRLLHCWRADKVGRSHAVPHAKTYLSVSSDFADAHWLVITSANMSKAAWGNLEKLGSQLMIRAYEAGVFIRPTTEAGSWPLKDLLLPFDLPPQPYSSKDEPWTWDKAHKAAPDTHGNIYEPG